MYMYIHYTYSILLCNNADTSTELRELAACIIMSNPDKFSSMLLGKTNTDYTQWLFKSESWGGGIELIVFSEHYKVELDVVDIQTQRVDRFGETMCAIYMYTYAWTFKIIIYTFAHTQCKCIYGIGTPFQISKLVYMCMYFCINQTVCSSLALPRDMSPVYTCSLSIYNAIIKNGII